MAWLIIILAILLIAGPAYALLPSAKQRRQMAMRREAMGEGIGVELTQIEDPDPDPEKYLSATGRPLDRIMSVAAYRLNRQVEQGWRRQQPLEWCVVRSGIQGSGLPAGWEWHDDINSRVTQELKGFIQSHLDNVPDDVIRIDEKNSVVSVYWTESDEEDAPGKVIDFLKACVLINPRIAGNGDENPA